MATEKTLAQRLDDYGGYLALAVMLVAVLCLAFGGV
jgi:hypothetical protein